MDGFSLTEASRYTRATVHQIRYWKKVGLICVPVGDASAGARRRLTFRDLVMIRIIRSLLDNGMSLQRVRRAWDYVHHPSGCCKSRATHNARSAASTRTQPGVR